MQRGPGRLGRVCGPSDAVQPFRSYAALLPDGSFHYGACHFVVDVSDLASLLVPYLLLGHLRVASLVKVFPHLAASLVDVRPFLAVLLDLASGGVGDHSDVAGGVQIDADPLFDLSDRRLVDGHGDVCVLVVELDLVDLVEQREMADVETELEAEMYSSR